jgi:hypothetical protein
MKKLIIFLLFSTTCLGQYNNPTGSYFGSSELAYVSPIYLTSDISCPGLTTTNATDLLSITLPTAGTWRLMFSVRGYSNTAAGGFSACITNSSNILVPNSQMMVSFSWASANVQLTSFSFCDVVTTTPNTIYKLRGYSVNVSGCGFALSDVVNGRTCIGAIKLKN